MLSIFAPASRLSKIADTGIRVPFNTHAPLTLPGILSTAGHCDQSRFAMAWAPILSIALQPQKAKATFFIECGLYYAGDDLLSHTLSRAVQSARRGLTSVFGMGTGGSPAVRSPTSLAAFSY